jgi:hypothetical protein
MQLLPFVRLAGYWPCDKPQLTAKAQYQTDQQTPGIKKSQVHKYKAMYTLPSDVAVDGGEVVGVRHASKVDEAAVEFPQAR